MSYSPQVKLMKEWFRGFEARDLNSLEKWLHKDLRQITYPQTIGGGTRNKDQYVEYLHQIVPRWTESKITFHSITEAPGKVICHFTNQTKTADGPNPPYEAIMITTLVTDSDGTLKIKQIEEFVDSQVYAVQMEAFAAN